MLFVEHDMDMVHDISDWVVVMAEGRVIAEGTPDAIGANHGGDRRLPRRPPRRRPGGWASRGARALAEERPSSASRRGRRRPMDERRRRRDVVAGYVPEVNILNGCNLVVERGRVRRHHRPERRRQVDVPEGGARAGAACAPGTVHARRRGHHRAARPTSSSSAGVGYVPQNAQRVPEPHRARRTSRWAATSSRSVVPRALRVRHRRCSRACASGATSAPASLSGGERQMVAMGRALMLDPSVLLLDEPSAGLSPVLQDQVFLQCRQINDAGRGDPDGRAERPPLPAGVRPRLRARPGPQRLHRHRAASCSPTRR